MSNAVSVIIPPELRTKAKRLEINISEICRTALGDAVLKKEHEARENAAKQNTRTADLMVGT